LVAVVTVGRNGFRLECEKQPATGARGVVCCNHPMAAAAGAEVLMAGGNAVDAAVATLFALTVVEPMMVGIAGGGIGHLRMASGAHEVIDGLSAAPAAATPDMYRPTPGSSPELRQTEGRANEVGALAVAVPAALPAWADALARHGTWHLADVIEPAYRLAMRGFRVSPYLAGCINETAADLLQDRDLARRFLPDGTKLAVGSVLVQQDYAETLRAIALEGIGVLQDGALGGLLADSVAQRGGIVTRQDLRGVHPLARGPIPVDYRGFRVWGPPPPASAGVHVAEMLNILEGFDIGAMGFGTADSLHLVAEALKIAFADRAVATADPDFVNVPVTQLISKEYAARRRAELDTARAQDWAADPALGEGTCTTHVTVADAAGNIVATTQTINSLFGARIAVPGTGIILNNYMHNFDPFPGRALSVAPGKRVYTSMAPTIVMQADHPCFALGLPGGLRIFPSAFQALLNLIDHRMPLQAALEAPRIWTMGGALELEPAVPADVEAALVARGHAIKRVKTVGGGINGIAFGPDGEMTGAACWRADGSVVALGGGLARAGVRFSL
jgi:gamma-glutamyltranspeptidase/glutathione hydrolase